MPPAECEGDAGPQDSFPQEALTRWVDKGLPHNGHPVLQGIGARPVWVLGGAHKLARLELLTIRKLRGVPDFGIDSLADVLELLGMNGHARRGSQRARLPH